ncbi:DNA-directed RNA polymerase subunit [Plasmodiophora brassicae]
MGALVDDEIAQVSFKFYTPAEVRSLSVKAITVAEGLDALKQPIPGGLYDLAMGPIDRMAHCASCHLRYECCPGHVGHVELPVPIYNPLAFKILNKILKQMCQHCHRLRHSGASLQTLATKLGLIDERLLYDADRIDTSTSAKAGHKGDSTMSDDEDEDAESGADVDDDDDWRAGVDARIASVRSATTHDAGLVGDDAVLDARRATVRQWQHWSDPAKCERCERFSLPLRSEGTSKIFIMPYRPRTLSAIAKLGVDHSVTNVLTGEIAPPPTTTGVMLPNEAMRHMEILYDGEDGTALKALFPNLTATSFFLEVLIVPPCKYRPPIVMGDVAMEHPENTYFKTIIKASQSFSKISSDLDNENATVTVKDLYAAWLEMQNQANMLMDSDKAPAGSKSNATLPGVRQRIEKKQGLFRQNLMGKRVNFSCRSVISPDPYLHVGEIGIPEMFARQLTYPEPVTPFNVELLRQMVINGPYAYPGANYVENEHGHLISLSRRTKAQRVAIASTLLTGAQFGSTSAAGNSQCSGMITAPRKVFRHLQNGDVLLVNRQPTLHKASMMAHKARILQGQQTIRMHYANCNTYNADFDGDEINVHFPQSELARAEGYTLANTDNQYLTPKDGSPLRGLIQDHVVAGVLITKRDTFFTRDEFHQLLYSACMSLPVQVRVPSICPAILRPVPLYTGKQLVSCIIYLITRHSAPLNIDSKNQIPHDSWGGPSRVRCEEASVVVRGNDLLVGVLDKTQFGAKKFGLVHCVYELYGSAYAGDLLTALGRLFTAYLQTHHAFTCGLDDLLLQSSAERARQAQCHGVDNVAMEAAVSFTGSDVGDKSMAGVAKRVHDRLRQTGKQGDASLDSFVKSAMNGVTSSIISASLPVGQWKSFPSNNFSMMTISGAKGSKVNFSQISCLLGQQELEGRRVPRMASGRTLPCFRPYDVRARAGGFIANRFLTGIRPAEYYFHCMAGREGLVDTAVKTSRSGYLQRCLVKHLESLSVQYDYTVRNERGDVVMFQYGEDSIDVTKSLILRETNLLANNFKAVLNRLNPGVALTCLDPERALQYWAQHESARPGSIPDPILSLHGPGSNIGCVAESFQTQIRKFCDNTLDVFDKGMTREMFELMMWLKYMSSLVDPGENVGVLTAQSIGEPSTQMTLNTFHLAGFGGANVTLGIPRLVEIIMTASAAIKTPLMEVYLRPPNDAVRHAEQLAHKLRQIKLSELVDRATCSESIGPGTTNERRRLYRIELHMRSLSDFDLSAKDLVKVIENGFVPRLLAAVAKVSGVKITSRQVQEPANERSGGDGESGEDAQDDAAGSSAESDAESVQVGDDGAAEDGSDDESGADDDMATGSDDDDEGAVEDGAVRSRQHFRSPYLHSLAFGKAGRSVQIVLQMPLHARRLLIMSLIDQVQSRVLVHNVPGITKCYVTTRPDPNDPRKQVNIVQTDGVNFSYVWEHADAIDVNQIRTNDIAALLTTYGVESARAAIVREITAVFAVYGISVDYRHLYLLADYMTFDGGFRPLNRTGMDASASPWLKMTYETSCKFMLDACLFGEPDRMRTPSSQIILGQVVRSGTGAFELMQPLSTT